MVDMRQNPNRCMKTRKKIVYKNDKAVFRELALQTTENRFNPLLMIMKYHF